MLKSIMTNKKGLEMTDKIYTKRDLINLTQSELIMIILESKIKMPIETNLNSNTINSLNSIRKEKSYNYTFAKLGEQIYKKIVWVMSLKDNKLSLVGTYMKPDGSVDGKKESIYIEEPLNAELIVDIKKFGIDHICKVQFIEVFEMYSKRFNFSSQKKLATEYEYKKKTENMIKRGAFSHDKKSQSSSNTAKIRPTIKF